MAYEAVKVELTEGDGWVRRFAKGSGAIVKGQLLSLFDARTASGTLGATVAAANPAAGIAAEDAATATTVVSVYTDGIFDMYASGVIVAGNPVVFVTNNRVAAAASTASGSVIAGYALETASADEQINVRIRL